MITQDGALSVAGGGYREGTREEVIPDQLPIREPDPAWDSKKPQYYLSHDGRTELGPFPIKYVKWMIRHNRFSPDVLIRSKAESGWTVYRNYRRALFKRRLIMKWEECLRWLTALMESVKYGWHWTEIQDANHQTFPPNGS